MKRILIAGVGNILLGDDAFGVEVVQALKQHLHAPAVRVVDFGCRPHELTQALRDGYDAIILVDATPRGKTPGTVSLIMPDVSRLKQLEHEAMGAHTLTPAAVLHLARTLGGSIGDIFLVGCEPANLVESEDGDLGVSESVHATVPACVAMIELLVEKLLGRNVTEAGLVQSETGR